MEPGVDGGGELFEGGGANEDVSPVVEGVFELDDERESRSSHLIRQVQTNYRPLPGLECLEAV